MTTLYQALKEVALRIGDVRQGVATGGSTTTLVDTNLDEPDGYYNGGTLFLETSPPMITLVYTWQADIKTFTIRPVGITISAGTPYLAVGPRYPLDVLRNAIAIAVFETARQMEVYETTTDGTAKVTLPDEVWDVRHVEYEASEGQWKTHYAWRIKGGDLYFLTNPPESGTALKIFYASTPAIPQTYSATFAHINTESLIINACKQALIWRNYRVGRDEPNTTELLNYYLQLDQQWMGRRPKLLPRDPIFMGW